MSLAKAIEHGKERRRPYYRSQRFDYSCRPGGSCPWCRRNRTIQAKRVKAAADDQERCHGDRVDSSVE